MPGLSDREQEVAREQGEFLERSETKRVELEVGRPATLEVAGTNVEVVLIRTAWRQFAWGGCGNNIGPAADLTVRVGKGGPSEITLGPRPGIMVLGTLRLALAAPDARDNRAAVAVGPA
jgi:hypothetical protein